MREPSRGSAVENGSASGNGGKGIGRVAASACRRGLARVKLVRSGAEKRLYLQGVLRPDPDLLPDFLGIGLRKSGTTWLYENLRAHAQVDGGLRKSHHYFNKNFNEPFRSYLANFSSSQKTGALIRGEVTTGYALVPEARIRFMRSMMPEVRLILLLRNPIEREWSLVVHHAVKHGIPIPELTDDFVIPYFERSDVRRAGGYSAVIERWRSIFPPEQLFIGFYEQIASDPRGLLSAVFDHVGVSKDIAWNRLPFEQVIVPPNGPQYRNHDKDRGAVAMGHTNSSRLLPSKYRSFLSDMYHADIERLSRIVGGPVPNWARAVERGGDAYATMGQDSGQTAAVGD